MRKMTEKENTDDFVVRQEVREEESVVVDEWTFWDESVQSETVGRG